MKIRATEIKVGDTVGDLTIRAERETPLGNQDVPEPLKCRVLKCICICGNLVEKLDTELEYYPPCRKCEACIKRQINAKTLWLLFLEKFVEKESKTTKLHKLFRYGYHYYFDEFSRTLIIRFKKPPIDDSDGSIGFILEIDNLREYTHKERHRWKSIAKDLNVTIKFERTNFIPFRIPQGFGPRNSGDDEE
jgi:hypothetical protein